MAKKSFQKEINNLMNHTLSQMLSGDKPKQETPKEKKPVGRPRKKSSTCQNGLPEGETRMTFLVSEVHQDKLKYISYRERLSLKQIMSEAIQNYLNDYESIYGEIDLNA